ncbi:hypothetical protein L1856_03930 [Streptomyces sp. Tue 6430]|nr:hypothetical protein [Streptomyces sp. Tue 6430]
MNQSRPSAVAVVRAPGSVKACVAPGTTAMRCSQRIQSAATRLRPSTRVSSPPTTRSVGASTAASAAGPARSGRPPRDTTARMSSPAAASRAAAAPVPVPK